MDNRSYISKTAAGGWCCCFTCTLIYISCGKSSSHLIRTSIAFLFIFFFLILLITIFVDIFIFYLILPFYIIFGPFVLIIYSIYLIICHILGLGFKYLYHS